MSKKRVLTGVTTTGIPHLGNYVGAIRPAVRAAQNPDTESFLFLADYHGIIKCHEPEMIHQSTQAVAATWLACGLDPERTTFYRLHSAYICRLIDTMLKAFPLFHCNGNGFFNTPIIT